MAVRYEDFLKKLPKHERDAIAKRAAELLAEEASLQEMRKAMKRSQASVARKLKVKQAAVSKIEKRTDMYVSTLRAYVEAMGGSLDIIATFPGGRPVKITQFEELR